MIYKENVICLDKNYSTTKTLFKHKDNVQYSSTNIREGGLRTKGFFKKTFVEMPLVTIITPVFNGELFFEETIQSIFNQSYQNIEFIIIDGDSSDKTVDIIKKYEDKIDYWLSEEDNGMYDAIRKGFNLANGEIIAWLNADDVYFPHTINLISNVFKTNSNVSWLTGIATHMDEKSNIINVSCSKYYFKNFISLGYYRDDYLGFIQQESTFFRKSLLKKVDFLENLQFAADYDLWIKFSKYEKLFTIKTILSSFRIHSGQKSEQIDKYYQECNMVSTNKKFKFIKYLLKPLSILFGNKVLKPIDYINDNN